MLLKTTDQLPLSNINEAHQPLTGKKQKDVQTVYEKGHIPYNITSAPGGGGVESISQAQQNYLFYNPMTALQK
jgi:hypothetical protein